MKDFDFLCIRCHNNTLEVLDQRKLPDVEERIVVRTPLEMVELIRSLAVRGAPLIGVAAACSLALFAEGGDASSEAHVRDVREAASALRASRPTAVNLMWAIDRLLACTCVTNMTSEAEAILEEEVSMNERIANNGAALLQDGDTILTYCNTGSLATPGGGTALGVIRRAHEQGKALHVFACETRPLLQGGRLTTYELQRLGIPFTLITDNMAGMLMAQKKIHRVVLGSDRIAVNGDFANKIGTYSLAVLAHYHGIPFHPVAPVSTIDFDCPNGASIPIEERAAHEVRGFQDRIRWAPKDCNVYNPSFDVTPAHLVTSWILDVGVLTLDDVQAGAITRLASCS